SMSTTSINDLSLHDALPICIGLGIVQVAKVEFDMLTDGAYHPDGTHTAYGQQIEVAVPQDFPHRGAFNLWFCHYCFRPRLGFVGIVFDKKSYPKHQKKTDCPQYGQSYMPIIAIDELRRKNRYYGTARANT